MKSKYRNNCKRCGVEFMKPTPTYIFCDNCSNVGKEKGCIGCEKRFISKQHNQAFCSIDCRLIYVKNKEELSAKEMARFRIFSRDGFRCTYCGKDSISDKVKLTIDHVYPLSKGGNNKTRNLTTACHQCNSEKYQDVINPKIILEIWSKNEIFSNDTSFEEIESIFDQEYKSRTAKYNQANEATGGI